MSPRFVREFAGRKELPRVVPVDAFVPVDPSGLEIVKANEDSQR